MHGRLLLKDGDRVRLSNLAFSFFLCKDSQTLDETPSDILARLEAAIVTPTLGSVEPGTTPVSSVDLKTPTDEQPEQSDPKEETFRFLQEPSELEEPVLENTIAHLSPTQQSEILDRFFNRQIHKVSGHN